MTGHETGEDARSDAERDPVARLLRLAGPRPDVPEERARRVRGAVRVRWQEEVRARKRRRQWLLGTLLTAAALVVALGLAVTRPRVASPTGPAPSVATVEVIAGSVSLVDPASGATVPAKVGAGIPARSTVSTEANGRVALRLAGGASLRADHGTRLALASAQDVLLERGSVYVDNAPTGARAALQVRTELGVLRDVGTQFEVRLGEGVLRLRVREGMVALDRDAGSETAEAGVELTVERGGRIARRSVLAGTSDWGWTLAIAPAFAIEGRRLPEFLRWTTRETGWRLQFASPELEESIGDVVLHGSISGLAPEEALAAVLPTCGLAFRVEGGALHVERDDARRLDR